MVFVRRYEQPWKSLETAWRNAVKRAGITDFRFHDNRHCFGSWLAQNDVAEKGRMDLMGHKTASMSARYAHLVTWLQAGDRGKATGVGELGG